MFCSKDLKRFLAQKDPETGIKNGRVDPSRDQHMAHEKNRNGKYYCVSGASGTARLGAACDFRIVGLKSDRLVEWILEQQLPFDSLYYHGSNPCGICKAARPSTSATLLNKSTMFGRLQTEERQQGKGLKIG